MVFTFRRAAASILTVSAGLVLSLAPPSAAAELAPNCTWWQYDRYTGIASAGCTGYGSVRFLVSCDAIPPLSPWVRNSAWIAVNGGLNPTAQFPTCPYPAGASVRMQYL